MEMDSFRRISGDLPETLKELCVSYFYFDAFYFFINSAVKVMKED